jgi:hypothetical protein
MHFSSQQQGRQFATGRRRLIVQAQLEGDKQHHQVSSIVRGTRHEERSLCHYSSNSALINEILAGWLHSSLRRCQEEHPVTRVSIAINRAEPAVTFSRSRT